MLRITSSRGAVSVILAQIMYCKDLVVLYYGVTVIPQRGGQYCRYGMLLYYGVTVPPPRVGNTVEILLYSIMEWLYYPHVGEYCSDVFLLYYGDVLLGALL